MAGGELIELEPAEVLHAAYVIEQHADEAYARATRYGCASFPGAPPAVEATAMQMCSSIMLAASAPRDDLQQQGEELYNRARLALAQNGVPINGPGGGGGNSWGGSGAASPSGDGFMAWLQQHMIAGHDIDDGRDRWRSGLLLNGGDPDGNNWEVFWGGSLSLSGPGFDKELEKMQGEDLDMNFTPNLLSVEGQLGLSAEGNWQPAEGLKLKAEGFVGAKADLGAGANFSTEEINAGLHGGVFLGAEADVKARMGNDTVGVEQEFGGIAGYAAEFDAGFSWKDGKLEFGAKGKLAYELGLSYGTHFSVNPGAIASATGHGLEHAGGALKDLGSSVVSHLPSPPW